MINLNKHRIDFGKGDVGIGVIGNTTDCLLYTSPSPRDA